MYADLVYRREGEVVSTDRAFILFVFGLRERVDELVLFGRLHPEPGRAPYALPEGVRHAPLPHYPRVTDLPAMLRALRGSVRAFREELRDLDVVWVFGPYPVSLLLALVAVREGTPLVLGVRQDFPAYVRSRLPGRGWGWAVAAARAIELAFRLLARRAPTVVVGEALAPRYRGGAPVLATGFSLVRDGDLVEEEEALARPWTWHVVTVGRVDAEKNPLLLPEILALLRERDPRWRLTVVGTGPLEGALLARARELGVDDGIELRGYVPAGRELWELYRGASAFLHVSLTEGLPQVLWEAAGAGTPIVATDVGGVAGALRGGELGLVVPPADARASADALERLSTDEELRRGLVARALAAAREETMDAQLDRIAALVREAVAQRRRRDRA